MSIKSVVSMLFVLVLLMGCETVPGINGQVYDASYIGDQDALAFDSFTVSVKTKDGEPANLHVSLAALVNQEKHFILPDAYSELTGIIRRLETRMQYQLITKILSLDPETISNTQQLHAIVTAEAQSIFDAEYTKWKKSSYFDVEIVITSLYFTDLSVGKDTGTRRW